MKQKPVIPREIAHQDAGSAVTYHLEEQAEKAALGFIDALERAYRQIGSHPGAGSDRYANELDLPRLRSWPLQRYPYLVFYLEQEGHVDVWRVLHAKRDIPGWLAP